MESGLVTILYAKRRPSGFTLLEVLIVIVIIALIGTMASNYLLPSLEQRQGRNAAQQLADQLDFAQYQALLNGRPYGFSLDNDGYAFYIFRQQQWLPATETLLSAEKIEGELQLSAPLKASSSITENNPDIILSPMGEISAFTLLWLRAGSNWQITQDLKGKMQVQTWQQND